MNFQKPKFVVDAVCKKSIQRGFKQSFCLYRGFLRPIVFVRRLVLLLKNMMKILKNFITNSTSSLQITFLVLGSIGFLAVIFLNLPRAQAAGLISGRVFQDFNDNGNYDTGGGTAAVPVAVDTGVQNVTVTAYDSVGTAQGTATTASDGTYTLSAGGSGPYRLEFTNLPSGFSPSARNRNSALGGTSSNSGSATQFVADGVTADVNFAVNIPSDYCQNNPLICATIYAFGDQNDAAIFTIPFTAGSTRTTGGTPVTDFQTPTQTILTTASQVGTTYGMAYSRSGRKIFASAFMKKHSAFGPGGPGAIYQIDRNNSNAVSVYANLNTLFAGNPAGTDPHNALNYNTDNGNATWDAVGKISFGGMAISTDETKLYVMNLNNRTLYELPANQTPTAANIRTSAFPATLPSCPSATDVRPFAVEYYRGQIYVGAVCSAETTNTTANLRAYIYRVDPTTLSFTATPVFETALNYPRLEVDPGLSAQWRAWRTTFATISGGLYVFPQPMLTDFSFDKGNLILALRDRNGDQTGYNAASNPSNSTQLFKGITAGEILRACGSLGSWTLESNGRCGGIGGAAQNTGEGPGNGEYYYQDNYHPDGNPHDEVGVGGVMQIPGFTVMAASVFDPTYIPLNNVFDAGGFRWFVNNTGAQNRGFLAYTSSTGDFGKANGIGGTIPALCDTAPIEIGNRVWFDINGNGVQDPQESRAAVSPVIASGITVRLYNASGVLIATAVTDQDGEYYFSSAAGTNTTNALYGLNLLPNTAYQIRFDNPVNYQAGGPLFGYSITTVNSTSQNGDDDSSDSDAVPVLNPVGSPVGNFPVISLTTGGAGANNHTFDVGFALAPTAASASVSGRILTSNGQGIRNVSVTLIEDDGTIHTAKTGSFGYYNFEGIAVGQAIVVRVSAKNYRFSPNSQVINLYDSLADVNFAAEGEQGLRGK